MTDKNKRAAEIEESIRRILFDDWDPLGLNDLAPDDEYDSYIGGVYRLIASGTSPDDLAAHLRGLEIESMGNVTNPAHRQAVASKLLSLDISLEN